MIVLPHAQCRWRLVHQMDHAKMCRQIAAAWQRPSLISSANWDRVILAAGHHDDGWEEADQHPMLDAQGRPYDFLHMPSEQHIKIWKLSLDRVAQRDLLAGLLVSIFACKLYHEHSHCGEVERLFVKELESRIKQQTAQLTKGSADDQAGIEPVSLMAAASLLAFFDGLSLQMLGTIPWRATWEGLDFGETQASLSVGRQAGLGFTLDPWPLTDVLTLRVQTSQEKISFTLNPCKS